MIAFLTAFWKPIAAVVAVLVLASALALYRHNLIAQGRTEGRAEIQTKWDQDKAARIKATTDQVLLWDAERQKFEKAEQERDREHELRIAEVNQLAAHLPPAVAAIVVPRAAIGVLDAAVRDTGTAARPNAKPVDRVSAAAKPADK